MDHFDSGLNGYAISHFGLYIGHFGGQHFPSPCLCSYWSFFSFVFLTSHFLHCFPFLPRVLTLLVGWQEGHPTCKKLVEYWYGYLSGARCSVCVCVFHSVFFVLSFPILSVSLLVKFSRRSVKPFEMLRPVGRNLTDIGYCCSQEWCL